MHGMFLQD